MIKKIIPTLLLVISLNANASGNYNYSLDDDHMFECSDIYDPAENVNRKIFYFNSFIDHITLKPMAKAYNKFLSDYTKNRVGDFVQNIHEPVSIINYGLQGNLDKSLQSFWRLFINTIFGFAGTSDIATELDFKVKPQNFGATLAHYGVGPGPYIVLPVLGSTNVRDMWDTIIFDSATNPIKLHMNSKISNAHTAARLVSMRAEIMPFTDYIAKNSTDPYVGIRSALHQRRESTIHYPFGYRCGVRLDK